MLLTRDLQGNLLRLAKPESSGGDDTVAELQAAEVEHGQVHQLHGAGEGEARVGREREAGIHRALGAVQDLHVEPHPGVGSHRTEAPVEPLEDHQLHLQDFLLCAGAVRHVGELLQLGRVDLLNLGSNEEACDADQLEPVLRDGGRDCEEAVNEVDCEVEGLAVEPVYLAHLDQPVQQNSSHAGLQGGVAPQ